MCKSLIVLGLLVGSLPGCSGLGAAPTTSDATQAIETVRELRPLQASDDSCDLNGKSIGIDSYKVAVANHIARSNLGNTFEGRLPPMLPAVVVLRLTVDSMGRIVDAYVQRSRNEAASKIALASLRRAGNFPLPCSLIDDRTPLLSFSETFLFNDQFQFQLRSIAGAQ